LRFLGDIAEEVAVVGALLDAAIPEGSEGPEVVAAVEE
jgi:hypothetical protein